MRRVPRLALLSLVGAGSFALAFAAKTWRPKRGTATTVAPPPANSPDSVKLAAMGINAGRQVIVYVLVASRCGHCQKPETKAAIRSIRELLRQNKTERFRSASVVGVALDANLVEGFEYLNTVGLGSFDEISVGNAWLNEHLVRLVWREKAAEAAVPQVVILSRGMTADFRPLNMKFTGDSLLKVFSGRNALVEWVRDGAIP